MPPMAVAPPVAPPTLPVIFSLTFSQRLWEEEPLGDDAPPSAAREAARWAASKLWFS